ncbi:MAG: TIGR03943 family protein [Clostridia bacterium]|nr:TIGR03943 family protein [Clostridia bacterium]
MDIPVYLVTGFLEAGKTSFIQETLTAQPLLREGNMLLIVCEEGIEEFDPTAFASKNVYLEQIEDAEDLTPALLSSLQEKHQAMLVMVEYNGMWQLRDFYENLPENWNVFQEIFICDSLTIENYNRNMRSLVVDKLSSCDLAVFNRTDASTDQLTLHKLVRGVSRTAGILYDMTDGSVVQDTIEDPLPFDINADIVKIQDRDFAYFYRDLVEDIQKYDGKKIRFKGMVIKDETIPTGSFVCGRHVMTCCADDIQFNGIACKWKNSETLKTYRWVEITGKISIEKHKMYTAPGPVLKVTSLIPAAPPEMQVATFD